METVVEKLRKEIEELESQIASHPFGSLFDKKRSDQMYQKLKKKRKELARAEGLTSSMPAPQKDTLSGSQEPVIKDSRLAKPELRNASAKKKTAGQGTKAKTGTKKTTKTATKPKPSKGSTRTAKKPSSRKASGTAKGKAKTSRASTVRKPAASKKKK